MKSLVLLLLVLALALGTSAVAEEATPYAAIYSSQNPVPQIARDVRPAVVQVISNSVTWSRETGTVTQPVGSGSGVYIDERGYIITNYHVLESGDEAEIQWLDGAVMPAEIVGFDDGTDLAVLKFEGEVSARPVPLGDSDALQIGELAIAIGNPGTMMSGVLTASVTAGIISALERDNISAGNFTRTVKVVQTDAAINTGNSGGALLNARGELIAIPTLKLMYDYSSVYEGLGFAVPINTVKPIFEQIVATGRVVRPRMGVMVLAMEGPEEPLRSHVPAGVQVMEIEEGGPASSAGMLRYDVIMQIEGKRVTTVNELTSEIDSRQEGDTVMLKVCRFYSPLTAEPLPSYEILEIPVVLALTW